LVLISSPKISEKKLTSIILPVVSKQGISVDVKVGGISVAVGVIEAVSLSVGSATFVGGKNGVLELELVGSFDSVEKTGIA